MYVYLYVCIYTHTNIHVYICKLQQKRLLQDYYTFITRSYRSAMDLLWQWPQNQCQSLCFPDLPWKHRGFLLSRCSATSSCGLRCIWCSLPTSPLSRLAEIKANMRTRTTIVHIVLLPLTRALTMSSAVSRTFRRRFMQNKVKGLAMSYQKVRGKKKAVEFNICQIWDDIRFELNSLSLGFTPDIPIKLHGCFSLCVYAGPSDSCGDFAGDPPIRRERVFHKPMAAAQSRRSDKQEARANTWQLRGDARPPSPLSGVAFGMFIIGHLYNEALLNSFDPATQNVANRWQCLFTFRHGDGCQRNWNFLGTTCFKTKASKPFAFFLPSAGSLSRTLQSWVSICVSDVLYYYYFFSKTRVFLYTYFVILAHFLFPCCRFRSVSKHNVDDTWW